MQTIKFKTYGVAPDIMYDVPTKSRITCRDVIYHVRRDHKPLMNF
jgi:hypothetical protein